ncbi:MAG: DEAD/DEAH box helicase [Gemmatimonadaceae bacterium]
MLGKVSLHPHQISAVSRVELALAEFGGALLCDEVGMGKTFVAAAIARQYRRPLVVAPATLRQMWKHALATTGIDAALLSFEKLSRLPSTADPNVTEWVESDGSRSSHPYDIVIIDEAHHARNHSTRCYAQLKRLTRDANVLLLSATPIHNRPAEMHAVLSLFLGSRANTLTESEFARCILRREHGQIAGSALMPRILPAQRLPLSDHAGIVVDLMSLPDPVPLRDGGSGGQLIGRGLVHQWASSEAALRHAVRRRIARSAALIASLEAGTYPTERELRTWTFDDGALQLGFAELLSPSVGDTAMLLESVRRHANALDAFRAHHASHSSLDAERASLVLRIRASHPNAKIVAFSQYAETVSMLFLQLRSIGGGAMLTSRGARVAGGTLSRAEALARFAPEALNAARPLHAEQIDLLLATDLLSEGVNLQDAQVVVHLDLPWTAARMQQRVGRVARMGSRHLEVHTYLISPPPSAEKLLASELLIARKWNVMRRVVGTGTSSPFARAEIHADSADPKSISGRTETLREILDGWREDRSAGWDHHSSSVCDDNAPCAAIASNEFGFIAAVTLDGRSQLVVCLADNVSTDVDSQITACKLGSGYPIDASCDQFEAAATRIRIWAEAERASMIAGISLSKAGRRKILVNRIDAAIEAAPPHRRTGRLTTAARARVLVTTQQSAAVEADLAALARSDLPDDEWLQAITRLETRSHQNESAPTDHGLTLHALLLLGQR